MTGKVRDGAIEFYVWVNNRREDSIVASTHDEALQLAERRWVGVRRVGSVSTWRSAQFRDSRAGS